MESDARATRPGIDREQREIAQPEGKQSARRELTRASGDLPRHRAVSAHLHEKAGDLEDAARLYAEAAALATNVAERTHLSRQAARLRMT